MKKSLVGLAVLAATGAALAQSSVSAYGELDVWFGGLRTDNGAGATTSQTAIGSGGIDESYWGLKGSEDLGGGLRANFALEQGFEIDSGAAGAYTGQGTGSQAFDRQSWVGLSGNFGEIQIGKVWSAYDDITGASNAIFDSAALAPVYRVFKSVEYIDRPTNGLRYTSPEIAGFTGAVSYSLDEDSTTNPSVRSVSLSYAGGPLAAQLGYQEEETIGVPDNASFTMLGASYDFNILTTKLIYAKADNVGSLPGVEASEWQIGADIPLSPAMVVSVSYAKSDDSQPANVFEAEREGYAIAATYTLSKRTYLYGGYTYSSETQPFADDATSEALALGIRHSF